MNFWDSITTFFADNVNIVMIFLGIFILGMMFLLLYFEKKRNIQYEQKIRQEKQKQQEIKEDIILHQINQGGNLVEKVEDDSLAGDKSFNIKNDVLIDEESLKDNLILGEIEDKEIEKVSNAISDKSIIEDFGKDENNLLEDYESVIKESDAMLEAMQNIIDDNIEEMENLEKQNLDNEDGTICQNDKIKIVSKYKVLYDKVKKDWVVKKEGATRATKRCKTREDAVNFAKKCTMDSELGLTFHKKNGKFQKKAKK